MVEINISEEAKFSFLTRSRALKMWYDTPTTKEYMYLNVKTSMLEFAMAFGACSYKYQLPVQIQGNVDTSYLYSLSTSKFINGLSKFNNVIVKLSENVIVFTDGSISEITMPVSSVAYSEEMLATIMDKPFKEASFDGEDTDTVVIPREVFENFFPMFYPYMENVEKKNSLLIDKTCLMYGDKVFLIRRFIKDLVKNPILLSKDFLAIYFSLIMKLKSEFKYNYTTDESFWKYSDDSGTISLMYKHNKDQSEIAVPIDDATSNEFFNGVADKAGDKANFTCSVEELMNVAEFFNGFYDNVIWKPITFDFSKKDSILTKYLNSTGSNTSLVKQLNPLLDNEHPVDLDEEGANEYILAIDYIKNVISQLKPNDEITFAFSSEASGVRMFCKEKDIDCCLGIFVN